MTGTGLARADPPARRRAAGAVAGLAAACAVLLAVSLVLAGCADVSRVPDHLSVGPDPALPRPEPPLIPTVNIAPAVGWPDGAVPRSAAGLQVVALARGLDHPRWLHVLPNGDVLVAESNAPPKPDGVGGGLVAWVTGLVMERAGAGVPSADRITLLRDADGDGVAETRSVFLDRASGLRSPFGMALVGDTLYVANADGVVGFPYVSGALRIDAPSRHVADLPAGRNHHWTKNLLASPDGRRLYATVGSNSNIGENGMDVEQGRAAIWEIDLPGGDKRLFAEGLRNPNGLAWEPRTGVLWTVVNERDLLGSDLVPDYLTAVQAGAHYGWPYSYWGRHVDDRVQPQRPDVVARAVRPDYALGNHVAPLGLAFAPPASAAAAPWPAGFRSGAFIGRHGSWNRQPRSGYDVVFVPFSDGRPSGPPVAVLGGFVSDDGRAFGRPVGVAFDARGALLVADDVGNTVWRVAPGR